MELKEKRETEIRELEEKTRALQEKIDEIEKINRATIGRELKMIQLKGEIEKLRKELEKYKPST